MPQPIFHMNEIAIIHYPEDKRSFHGRECEIVSGVSKRPGGKIGYYVMVHDLICTAPCSQNGAWFAAIEVLRKKRPPLGSWEEVEEYAQWNPNTIEA